MRSEVIRELVDPRASGMAPLELSVFEENGGHVLEGVLGAGDGHWYPIIDGVPCFLLDDLRPDFSQFATRHQLPRVDLRSGSKRDDDQRLTNVSFSDKWRRFKRYGLDESHGDFLFRWYCKKLDVESVDALRDMYAGFGKILEVGPGSGFNTRFMAQSCPGKVFALDISDAARTTYENTRDLENCCVVQADLMNAPFEDASFDFIIADGVLHHTPDTRAAVVALYRKLKPGGQFFFYVYRKMGAARQYSDRFIRERYTQLSTEECYQACEAITELGRELSLLDATITLSRPIEVLGIPAGTHDVQRLLYYNFVKCFWNEAFDFETNNMVNFDWYHPHNAWQHDEEEVAGWLDALDVETYSFNDANPNGISALLTKPAVGD